MLVTFCPMASFQIRSRLSVVVGILVRGLIGPVVAGGQQRRWAPRPVLDVEVAVPTIDVSPTVVALGRLSRIASSGHWGSKASCTVSGIVAHAVMLSRTLSLILFVAEGTHPTGPQS